MKKITGLPMDEAKVAGCRAYSAGFTVMETVSDVHNHFRGIDWIPAEDDAGAIVAEVDQMIAMLDQAIQRARRIIERIPGFEEELDCWAETDT